VFIGVKSCRIFGPLYSFSPVMFKTMELPLISVCSMLLLNTVHLSLTVLVAATLTYVFVY